MRTLPSLLLIVCLAGCHRGQPDQTAVRQAMLDYLAKKGMNMPAMEINVADVKFNGDKADARVSFSVKGSGVEQMAIQYQLESKDGKWTVIGRQGADQHGAGKMPQAMPAEGAPGMANPHGGAMPAPGGGGKMPAPEDLPPASQKK